MSSIRELAFAKAIGGGGGGDISVQPLSVTENGKYTAPSGKAYTPVNVNVLQIAVESLSVTENGTYAAQTGNAYSPISVNVQPTLQSKTVTENGTVTADAGYDGLSSVTVNVSAEPVVQSLSVTQNGTYTPPSGVDGYAPVTVNVSGGGGGSDQLMSHGQVSDTSTYMTASFDTPIDFSNYDMIVVELYEGQDMHIGATNTPGTFYIERGSFQSGAYFEMSISTTSISCTSYKGTYKDLYVDVYGVNF